MDSLSAEYCRVVEAEIAYRLSKEPNDEALHTVYFGGGTPGYLETALLAPILESLSQHCLIAPSCEITIETTPTVVTAQKCSEWLKLGINRISIGVESLVDCELAAIGRGHSSAQAIEGVKTAKAAGFNNIALDLIYGLPLQTMESWQQSLEQLLRLSPRHLSAYNLTIANNSRLLHAYPLDSPSYPDEETFACMYALLVEKCREAGLSQYEIANFALPGYECKHNLTYWLNEEYLAFGAGAHRYYGKRRSSNFRFLRKYMRDFKNVENEEEIDKQTGFVEAVFLGLRLRRGINLSELERIYGIDLKAARAAEIDGFCSDGFLEWHKGNLRLTQKGVPVSNTILARLI